MKKEDEKEKILHLFRKQYTPYDIHLETNIPLKTVYHYVQQVEQAKARKNYLKRAKQYA